MQVTIARQLGLEPSTVGNFFMNARRRSMDKWKDDNEMNNKVMTMVSVGGGGGATPPGLSSGGIGTNNGPQMIATIQQSPTTVATTVVHMPQMGQMGQGQIQTNMVSGHCLEDQDL
ncbi:hypothetical protein HAZT_HAZT000610 [Hyalella azteca]|nr:hypothetical protein HAZT_HAZT000610 [Hyalella azteca]